MKSIVSITDLSADQILSLIDKSIELKSELRNAGIHAELPLRQRSMAMIFDKSSLRTRLSFEIGMTQLGGHGVYLAPDDIRLGARETVHDTAVVISGMADVIVARVSSHEAVQEMAKHSSVPVINAMTDAEHPCQALAETPGDSLYPLGAAIRISMPSDSAASARELVTLLSASPT